MPNLSDISVVLPSLDPDTKLLSVIDGLIEYGFTDIILINDGSKAECSSIFDELKNMNCKVFTHHKNYGKGRALKNAFNQLYWLEPLQYKRRLVLPSVKKMFE